MLSKLPENLRDVDAFAALFDHTLLKAEATPAQIRALCQEADELGCKTVCVNPCYVSLAARELRSSRVWPITVIGFPAIQRRSNFAALTPRGCSH